MGKTKLSRAESARRNMQKRWAGRDEYWRELISRQQAGDQSIVAFCRSEGVHTTSFFNWRNRLGMSAHTAAANQTATRRTDAGQTQTTASEGFIRLELGCDKPSGVCVETPNGMRIVVDVDFDAETLARVMSVVRGQA